MATIEMVAEKAGVSTASVSRALNGKPGIGKSTRERILAVCRELNYSPSSAARKLSFGRQAVVALVLTERDTPFSPFVSSLQQHLFGQLQRMGIVPEILPPNELHRAAEIAGSALVIAREPNDMRISYLEELGLPVVSIGKRSDSFWVAHDDFRGGHSLTELALSAGYSRPLFLEAEDGTPTETNLRAQGFKSACHEAHVPPEVRQFKSTGFQGIQAMKYILEKWDDIKRFDAFICNSDEIAFGALAALELKGVSVPTEKAVTGYDDLPGIESELTTVRQDFAALAERAVALLRRAMEGAAPEHSVLDIEVVRRRTL